MNFHGAHSYWKQGALSAQARRVWAGAGPQCAARTGAGAYRGGLPPTDCLFLYTRVF